MSQKRLRILIADPVSEACLKLFEPERFELIEENLRGDALMAVVDSFDGMIVRSGLKVTASVLAKATRLKAIARAGVGVDNIDLEAATRAGILVMNTPGGNTVAAAEQTMALMLTLFRKTAAADASVRRGEWRRAEFMGSELRGKVLGVVGLGKIGREVVAAARGFGMEVIGYDPVITAEAARGFGVATRGLDELFKEADVITLHVPLTDKTRYMVDTARIATMKPGARIINCARGGLINEADLAKALSEGRLAGAGLDVFEAEPPAKDHPLFALGDKVVLAPHLGASTEEAQESVGVMSAQQLRDYLLSGEVRNAVNTVALPSHEVEQMAPFVKLAQRLGSLHAQISTGAPRRLAVRFAGPQFEGPDGDRRMQLLSLAVLEGFFSHFLDAPVNRVSVPHFAREHGIKVEEERGSEARGFEHLLTVEVSDDEGPRTIAGTLFGPTEPRLVFFDKHRFDAVPEGICLIFRNDDKPGVLGAVASTLGAGGVNIVNVTLGRIEGAPRALAFMNLETRPDQATLSQLESLPGLPWVRVVEL